MSGAVGEALTWLFALRELSFGGEGVSLGFARPLPGWGWTLALVGCVAVGVWSYRRLDAPGRWRWALAGARVLVLALAVVLVSGPRLERDNERVERDWVLVLVDRSVSMRVADAPLVGRAGARATREEQLESALVSAWPALGEVAQDRRVEVLGFDAGVFDLGLELGLEPGPDAGGGNGPELPEARGRRTALGAALAAAVGRAAGRPLSAVVVLSDGKSVDAPGASLVRRLAAERVPVHVVPLGSDRAGADVAVEEAVGPEAAFARDAIPVRVRLARRGPAGRSGGVLRLVDEASGRVLDERALAADDPAWQDAADAGPGAGSGADSGTGSGPDSGAASPQAQRVGRAELTLTGAWPAEGEVRWRVEFEPSSADLLEENNTASLGVRVVDRPLRVLYVDGSPRWERRYLTSMLLREGSIRSSSLLLASGRSFIEEGDVDVGYPPTTDEGWSAFDVVILGDVRAGLFSGEQLEQLREHVASRGAGLLWIGGPSWTPASWRGTALEDLLPFTLGGLAGRYTGDVTLARASAADRYGVLGLDESLAGWPAYLSDPATGWSRLRWAQRIDEGALKPTAEALARFAPVSGGAGSPAVATMPYGGGRVAYVATDELWRYRYGRGEPLFERFYLPLVRMLARGRLSRTGRDAVLAVRPSPAIVDRPARVEVRLLEQSLVDLRLGAVAVRVAPAWTFGWARWRCGSRPRAAGAPGRSCRWRWRTRARGARSRRGTRARGCPRRLGSTRWRWTSRRWRAWGCARAWRWWTRATSCATPPPTTSCCAASPTRRAGVCSRPTGSPRWTPTCPAARW